ncbi:thioredoxin family protein [uncultured Tateyamaria sp.]|uniref:thioredoxin family protein n=1 Tax=uncultured Tateyamaria sp. TaxID=455651 RepID=UPI0026201EDB|nr:thioredoxin family protein [uncultured Tateyamaria sp.]
MPKSKKRVKAIAAQPKSTPMSRRYVLGGGAVASAVALGGGVWGLSSFRTYASEHDLSRVGNGDLAIVQIHDPQCPTCTALQKQTRRALRDFDDCGLSYLVADINTDEGAAFARRFNAPNVTLLLFDGQGALQRRVQGMQQASALAGVFAAHKATA